MYVPADAADVLGWVSGDAGELNYFELVLIWMVDSEAGVEEDSIPT